MTSRSILVLSLLAGCGLDPFGSDPASGKGDNGVHAGAPGCATGAPTAAIQPTWTRSSGTGTVRPTASSAKMVYDSTRGRAILYDGQSTWGWDGTAWTMLADHASGPRAIKSYTMAYDEARDRVVMFGGETNTFRLDETWEFDGTHWAKIAVTGTKPPARGMHAMGYDPARHRVVVYSGNDGNFQLPTDIWEWDGTTWQQITPAGSLKPSSRTWASLVYDPGLGGLVLVDGRTVGSGFPESDLWVWDGNAWSKHGTVPPYEFTLVVYDEVLQTLVAYGGQNRGTGSTISYADVFKLEGSSWSRMTTTPSGTAVNGHTGTYDRNRHRMLSFGGYPLTGVTGAVSELEMVTLPNHSPVISIARTGKRVWGPEVVAFANEQLQLQLSATDPDSNGIIYGADPMPANASLDPATGLFTFTPAPSQAGSLDITFGASDGDLCSTQVLSVRTRYDHSQVLPEGTVAFDSYVGFLTFGYIDHNRLGDHYYDEPGDVTVKLDGQNPGKVTVSLEVRWGSFKWESPGTAVLEPDGTFASALDYDRATLTGHLSADANGDLQVTIDTSQADPVFGDDKFWLKAPGTAYLQQR